jgi:acyl-coenzyme A synthetase/AMP-(fatty) acid ligase
METLSYYSRSSQVQLLPMTINECLKEKVLLEPDRIVYIFPSHNGSDEVKLTFKDVYLKAEIMAQNFLELGLQKGDRIGLLLPSKSELLIAYYACSLTGTIAVPLDETYGTKELLYILNVTQPKVLFIFDSNSYNEIIQELFEELVKIEKGANIQLSIQNLVVLNDKLNQNGSIIKCIPRIFKVWSYEEIGDRRFNSSEKQLPKIDIDDPFAILYTVSNFFLFLSNQQKNILSIKFRADQLRAQKEL